MNFLWTALLFLCVVINFGHAAPACQSKDCSKKRLPLLDNMKAPLMAEIDVSSMNEQLKQYIDGSITDDVRMSFNELIKNVSKADQEEENKYIELARKLTKLTEDHEKLEKKIADSEKNRIREKTVAFHAVVKDILKDLKKGQKIPFENVKIDTDGGFDGQTGIFTCPRSGTYMFITTLLAYPGKRVEINIKKNNKWFAAGYAAGPGTQYYGSGTTHGIVHLQKGDKVWNDVSDVTGPGEMIFKYHSLFMGYSISLD